MSRADSLQGRLRKLVVAISLVMAVILLASLVMLISSNGRYKRLLHNVTTASEFNQEFKNSIDQKMYYYVIESQYSTGLPIQEVWAAQELAKSLLGTTTQKESHQAISSVLNLCENLEQKIYQIQDAENYDDRLSQLENNIYVLTALVEEYMYNYLYCEAVELNSVQQRVSYQIVTEAVVITVVMAAAIVAALRYTIRLGRSITDPLVAMCQRAEAVSEGDLTVREPVKTEIREIETLSIGMEQMIGRLDAQIRESAEKQQSLRRTELALLQAQINPHFLYNTMDTIIWLIEGEKTQEAVEMVSNLSSFFRHSLSKGRDIIPLREEEGHVRSYLQIQQARYKDILEYEIDIDDSLGSVMLPKLTLQPLVENALYHGIKLKRALGLISIRGWARGDQVLLEVKDNGVGMTKERLEELRASLDSENKVGFGLSAVNQRLRLQFGPPYGLCIESTSGEGTTVTARIPYTKEGSL